MRPFLFAFQPPRHPLARLALGVAGLVLLGFFTVFGVVVAAIVLASLALRRLWLNLSGQRPDTGRQAASPDIIEGEFSVIEKPRAPLPRQ